MREYEKLKSPKEMAQWICNNVLHADCDNCEFGCTKGHNVIEEMLDKPLYFKKSRECVNCKKLFDCMGKPEVVSDCLMFEER